MDAGGNLIGEGIGQGELDSVCVEDGKEEHRREGVASLLIRSYSSSWQAKLAVIDLKMAGHQLLGFLIGVSLRDLPAVGSWQRLPGDGGGDLR